MPSSFFCKLPVSGLHLLVVAESLTSMVRERETDRECACVLYCLVKRCVNVIFALFVWSLCVFVSMFILGFAARVSVPVGWVAVQCFCSFLQWKLSLLTFSRFEHKLTPGHVLYSLWHWCSFVPEEGLWHGVWAGVCVCVCVCVCVQCVVSFLTRLTPVQLGDWGRLVTWWTRSLGLRSSCLTTALFPTASIWWAVLTPLPPSA